MLENVINQEALSDLAKMFANKEKFELAFDFEAKNVSLYSLKDFSSLNFIVKIAQELPEEVLDSKLCAVSLSLRRSNGIFEICNGYNLYKILYFWQNK